MILSVWSASRIFIVDNNYHVNAMLEISDSFRLCSYSVLWLEILMKAVKQRIFKVNQHIVSFSNVIFSRPHLMSHCLYCDQITLTGRRFLICWQVWLFLLTSTTKLVPFQCMNAYHYGVTYISIQDRIKRVYMY